MNNGRTEGKGRKSFAGGQSTAVARIEEEDDDDEQTKDETLPRLLGRPRSGRGNRRTGCSRRR